jgi:cell division protein FtsI (penicillin-binding protein 3)
MELMVGKKRSAPRAPRDWSGIKIITLAIVGTLCFVGVWVRAYHIQIKSGQSLVERAKRQYWASRTLQGERGAILDRKGRLLAKSVPTCSVFINPAQIEDAQQTIAALHRILGGSKKDLAALVREKSSFVWVARQIGDRQAMKIRQSDMPGVYLKEDWMRIYPQGHVAAQLLGFVGIDGKGLEGLEKSFDHTLSGSSARQQVPRDAAGGQLYSGLKKTQVDGSSITLTIDSVIQSSAEEVLAEAVKKFHGKRGNCLVVEVETGEILAWAHYPFFDPNQYGRSTPQVWRNRICLDLVEPGSTFKPFVVAASLQNKICSPDTQFFCENGQWQMGRNRIRDTHEYKDLSVDEIVRYSSNIGMSKIGLALGAEKLFRQLQGFGFLETTGVPVPGEARGMIRPPHEWTDIDLCAASFGQGVAVTPLQLARAYLVLASKGRMHSLRIVQESTSEGATRQVVREDVAQIILGMLRGVVEEDGTGTRARIPGVEVGGKTGTAQKPTSTGGYGETFLASFVGLIPAMEPKYLILAMVDEPSPQHYGGVVSAPVVRDVAIKMLAYRGESPMSWENGDQAVVTSTETRVKTRIQTRAVGVHEGGNQVPDLCGQPLRKAVELLARHGVVPHVQGQGMFVARQEPKVGTAWNRIQAESSKLWLTTERSNVPCP